MTTGKGPQSVGIAPHVTNINLSASANELTVRIRCDNPEMLERWANWANHEVTAVQRLTGDMNGERVTIQQDNYFDRAVRAA